MIHKKISAHKRHTSDVVPCPVPDFRESFFEIWACVTFSRLFMRFGRRTSSVQIWSTRPVQRQMRSLRSRGAHAMQMHGAWVGSLGRGQGSRRTAKIRVEQAHRGICVEQAHREGGFLGVLRGRHASFWLKFPVEPLLGLTRTVEECPARDRDTQS